MGGFMSITGEPDGAPQKAGVPIADLMAGMYAAVAINAALRHREATGAGQYIDIGMLDTQVATLSIQGLNYLATGQAPPRLGNAHPNIVPYQTFATADGDIILAVGNDGQFQRFCAFAGVPELAEDERFKTNGDRLRHREEVTALLTPVMAAQSSRHWIEGLEKHNVSCGPINTIDQAFADPQVQARGMQIEMPHTALGGDPAPLIASPIRMSATPASYRHAPPTLGEHTGEVLGELLGLKTAEIEALRERGVV
jgi:crotonobetainyl-CoA:carnitine CoA-transferase CaiB-like acyl-CoA transferase